MNSVERVSGDVEAEFSVRVHFLLFDGFPGPLLNSFHGTNPVSKVSLQTEGLTLDSFQKWKHNVGNFFEARKDEFRTFHLLFTLHLVY